MNISHKLLGCCLLLMLVTAGSLQAQQQSPQDNQESCRTFVQGFYDKFVRAQHSQRPTNYAFDQALSPELRRRLREDRQAQERDLVGLDFDPIAAGNEVYDRYEAREVTRKGDGYRVEVYCLSGKKRDPDQKMMHEVRFTGGRWVIMNIHYYVYKKGKLLDHHDLLTTLKALQEQRRINSK